MAITLASLTHNSDYKTLVPSETSPDKTLRCLMISWKEWHQSSRSSRLITGTLCQLASSW
ncbi:hypothetical protein DPMN_057581 [Dreissena polymorpha]|uniref:Uncharacterized protein n=1 Tax=Dreissena polymorpha TaxID=45954 RepID=A0A9D4C0D5_DREPO|nr:hypothetical protein DPMN_057581 [Dreissena polymorpha]